MRSRIVVLLFAAVCIYLAGYVQGSRRGYYCLYTAQYQTVDSATREPIEGHVTFSDRMDLFPKGLPTGGITFKGEHHKRAFAWLGLRSSTPVTLPIYNRDYVTGRLTLQPLDGGFYTVFNNLVQVIPLDRKHPANSKPDEGHQQ